MNLKLNKENFIRYCYAIIALTSVFWLISITEIILSDAIQGNYLSTLMFKLTNDFWAGLFIGLVCFPVFYLLNILLGRKSVNVIIGFFVILVLVQFSLVEYSLTTKVNLGADILGYSFDDAFMTVSKSESYSIAFFIPFIVFPLALILLYKFFQKWLLEKTLVALGLILIVVFGGIKLVFSDTSKNLNENKTAFLFTDVLKYQNEQRLLNSYRFADRNDYPLLQNFKNNKDVLSPFFNLKSEKPNIVFIVVEGLGGEFVDNDVYSGFTPYIDSLITESLYWKNFVSNTGRSFGILPSLFGSLPYGDKGFLEKKDIPSHLSLISLLKANHYQTNYYSGGPSEFDRKVNFLDYNGVDNIIDVYKYGADFKKTDTDDQGFSWGYPDDAIFQKALETMQPEKQPRLDIVMTISSHEPFIYPNQEAYMEQVDTVLNDLPKSEDVKTLIENNKEIFGCLLYTDASIKTFMEAYKKRPEYENTIFVITGDHRLIPITQKDKLCRFHVPFLIYSPLLKQPETFKSISSHLDVTPSLLQMLYANYKMNPLEKVAWLGEGLDTSKTFSNHKKIPLMRYKGSINDFIYNDYMYSDGELFKIKPDFGSYKVNEELLFKNITDSLNAFKKLNAYVTTQNKIFPEDLNVYATPTINFTDAQVAKIQELSDGKTFDELMILSRDLAHEKKFKTARLLCDYIINEYPNYTDARVLKGRTLAWEKDYNASEEVLLRTLKRAPNYEDTYEALLDLYWWSDQEQKSESIFDQARENNIQNPQLEFKMAKAYSRLNKTENAKTILDSLIAKYPEVAEYKTFENTLNQPQ
ncbi:sulfatase-like hydrolase/transferase [Gaetbulibacter aestuarii]|uniref:Sulfatase-like hydrolase/transferase n=1 Tax=Gaetbulibacter aestuarii TaxID=1502358 RepID=A0ABW7MVP0_9FLAO